MDLVKVSIEPKKLAKYTLKRACLRDFNLSEKQEHKQPINTCVKNSGTVSYLHTLANSRPLQGGRGLAEHPLSCHPQRSVWQPRKWKRKGKKKGKGSCGETASRLLYIRSQVCRFVQTETYIDAQCKGSYKKNQNWKVITRVKWKKTKSKSKQGVA